MRYKKSRGKNRGFRRKKGKKVYVKVSRGGIRL